MDFKSQHFFLPLISSLWLTQVRTSAADLKLGFPALSLSLQLCILLKTSYTGRRFTDSPAIGPNFLCSQCWHSTQIQISCKWWEHWRHQRHWEYWFLSSHSTLTWSCFMQATKFWTISPEIWQITTIHWTQMTNTEEAVSQTVYVTAESRQAQSANKNGRSWSTTLLTFNICIVLLSSLCLLSPPCCGWPWPVQGCNQNFLPPLFALCCMFTNSYFTTPPSCWRWPGKVEPTSVAYWLYIQISVLITLDRELCELQKFLCSVHILCN